MIDFTDLVDLAVRAARRRGARRQRRVLRAEGKPAQAARAASGAKASTPTAASGWTAGRRAAGGRRGSRDRHDWCIVRLGVPGVVRGVVVDTTLLHAATIPRIVLARRLRARPRRDRRRRCSTAQHGDRSCERSELCGRLARMSFACVTPCDVDAPAAQHLSRRRRRAAARLRRGVPDWDALRRSATRSISPPLVHGARVVDMQRHVLRRGATT